VSKYGEVRYWSASKSAYIDIDTMPTQYLRNALAKLEREMVAADVAVLGAMRSELDERDAVARDQAHEEALSGPDGRGGQEK
jgi:hypothetical protein